MKAGHIIMLLKSQPSLMFRRMQLREQESKDEGLSIPCTKQSEGVLNSLHKVTYKLSLSVRKAWSSGKANTARNYRRKRSQVKGLFSVLSDHVIPNKSSDEEEPHGSVYSNPVDTPYVLSTQSKRPYELKRLIRNAIMNEF
jgi:hypothetical protein